MAVELVHDPAWVPALTPPAQFKFALSVYAVSPKKKMDAARGEDTSTYAIAIECTEKDPLIVRRHYITPALCYEASAVALRSAIAAAKFPVFGARGLTADAENPLRGWISFQTKQVRTGTSGSILHTDFEVAVNHPQRNVPVTRLYARLYSFVATKTDVVQASYPNMTNQRVPGTPAGALGPVIGTIVRQTLFRPGTAIRYTLVFGISSDAELKFHQAFVPYLDVLPRPFVGVLLDYLMDALAFSVWAQMAIKQE